MVAIEYLTEGDAEHLTALVEDGFHHMTEETLVAAQVCHLITRHADDGTLYLGRRIKHARLDGEKILHIIPGLNQYGKDAILLVAWLRGHAQRHFMLNHTRTTRDEILIVEHLEEYLRGDVVWIVTRQHELLSVEHLVQVHPEEVATYYIIIKTGEMLTEIGHRLTVDLHNLKGSWFLHEILGHDTHARTNLQHGEVRTRINGVGNGLGYIQVCEKMLSEILFGAYLFHGCKDTKK